jgi:signal transduction histidine kinase
METTRWWHVAVLGTVGVLSVIAGFANHGATSLIGALAANGIFLLCWFLIGARAQRGSTLAITFVAITVAAAGVSTAFVPSMASIQCVAYPIVWVLSAGIRRAVIANIALAISVGLGLFISTGATMYALIQVLLIQSISVAFSLALGLWMTSIEVRSVARQKLLDELHAAQNQLSTLSRDAGVASERERLAREIHDTIAQDLTGLVLLAQRTSRELAAGNAAAAAEQLAVLEDGARNALAETRALVASTAPVGLDAGIAAALTRLGERFERETSITMTVKTKVTTPLDRDLEVVLLRCAQEGLANVRKHSGAEKASLLLDAAQHSIRLTISDNGSGFDSNAQASTGANSAPSVTGFGLTGMRERLALVSGSLDLTSGSKGTTLVVTLPVRVNA